MTGRALVLGGGGVTGIAWELGILAGLAGLGVDMTAADLVVGTSAGAVAGAQVTSGAGLESLYRAQLAVPDGQIVATMGLRAKLWFVWAMARSRDPLRARARLGRMALATPAISEDGRRAVIASRLPELRWPPRRLRITVVEARSGEFGWFDAASGVSLVDAVAASCAVPGVWPPVEIDGRHWMDGGMRSAANADLAAGCGRVVVLAPMTRGAAPMPSLASQIADLREHGSRVAVVVPGHDALAAIGRDVLDETRQAPAARAGYHQAPAVADAVRSVWEA